jgi:hypothetical protein
VLWPAGRRFRAPYACDRKADRLQLERTFEVAQIEQDEARTRRWPLRAFVG